MNQIQTTVPYLLLSPSTPDSARQEAMEIAEEIRAKERQIAAQNNNTGQAVKENLPEQVKQGQSRDIAASKIGMSGKTAEKAAEVTCRVVKMKSLHSDVLP